MGVLREDNLMPHTLIHFNFDLKNNFHLIFSEYRLHPPQYKLGYRMANLLVHSVCQQNN